MNNIVIDIWAWCVQHGVWITAGHISGVANIIADQESRKTSSDLEWALDLNIYKKAVKQCDFILSIDLFASRLNTKCQQYISYHPDLGAKAINAFTISWGGLAFYAFPPFCIILKTLRKIKEDEATGMIVVPHSPTQSWWPYLSSMLIAKPVLLPRTPKLLYLPAEPDRTHPLSRTMQLLICQVSGNFSKVKTFQTQLQTSSYNHGEVEPRSNIPHTYASGKSIVVNKILIPFQLLSHKE